MKNDEVSDSKASALARRWPLYPSSFFLHPSSFFGIGIGIGIGRHGLLQLLDDPEHSIAAHN